MDWICPLYIGERCTFSRMMRCVSVGGERDVAGHLLVVMRDRLVRKLKGVGSSSPGCT